jgi:ABC-type Co2+ transport system permease subunit
MGFVAARYFLYALENRTDQERWVLLGVFDVFIILVMRGSFHSMTSYYLMLVFWLVVPKHLVRMVSEHRGGARFRYAGRTNRPA